MFGIVGRAVEGIYQVMRGLKTVAQHSFRPPTTKEFPDIMPELPGEFRGRLALTVNPESGEHLCISCRQCERVCPDKCIEIVAHKSPETGKLELIDFRIDHGLCMFCGLCAEVCPTTCIINTNDFEMADYTRESLVYDLKRLTLTQEESAFYFAKKELPLPKPKPAKAAPKPAAAAGAEAAKPAAKPGDGAVAAKPASGAVAAKPEGPAEKAEAAKPAAVEPSEGAEPPGPAPKAKSSGSGETPQRALKGKAGEGEAEVKPDIPEPKEAEGQSSSGEKKKNDA